LLWFSLRNVNFIPPIKSSYELIYIQSKKSKLFFFLLFWKKQRKMLDQIKSQAAQAGALAKEAASSVKDVTSKGAEKLNIKILTVSSSSTNNSSSSNSTASKIMSLGGQVTGNGDKNQEEEGLLDDFTQQCQLTKRQRLYGALGCYALGALCSLFSSLTMFAGPKHVKQFAFFYTVGSLSGIGSSLFLVGPKNQFKVMCMPVRRVACCIWIGCMILTLIIAFGFPKAAPLLLFLIVSQYAAMLWYGASFIPYGRTILKKVCQKAAGTAMSSV
jgi:hypothetical protein